MKFRELVGDDFLDSLAEQYGITRKQVYDIYMSYWGAIHEMVTAPSLDELYDDNFNEQEFFKKYKTSVRIHGLGYLYCNAETVRKRKLYLKLSKERKLKRIQYYETKKNQANVDISNNHGR